mmetsp:Transcript_15621/g.54484  ORF Transcript_15621/g.54484 Transcript_15621/m.54484 type:complete len:82 (+) Transcript_15621:282-527(+)
MPTDLAAPLSCASSKYSMSTTSVHVEQFFFEARHRLLVIRRGQWRAGHFVCVWQAQQCLHRLAWAWLAHRAGAPSSRAPFS